MSLGGYDLACVRLSNSLASDVAELSVGHAGVTVWEKLKQEKQQVDFKMDQEEEFEDSQGNVMSRKTYEDLRRQGLL